MVVAHSMLIAIYYVLSGNEYCDLGAAYYTQFNKEKKIPIPANVLGAIQANLEEIVRCSVMFPFACKGYRRIYTAYITDFMEGNGSNPQGPLSD